MIEQLVSYIKHLSQTIPLSKFAFFGGLIEEIVAPIPSPFIMMSVGSVAQARGQDFSALLTYSLLSALAKTIGSWLIYVLVDKMEDVFMKRFGKWLGVSHKEVESVGEYFDDTWKDDVLVVILRAFPLLPGAVVSVVCGFIKLGKVSYLRATLVGTFIRSLMFGVAGYIGASEDFLKVVDSLELAGKIILLVLGVATLIGLNRLRNNGGIQRWLKKHFGNNKKES